jgi:hypothetical protein
MWRLQENLRSAILPNVTLCAKVIYRRFGVKYCLHFRGPSNKSHNIQTQAGGGGLQTFPYKIRPIEICECGDCNRIWEVLLRNVTLCGKVIYRRFGVKYCLHFRGRSNKPARSLLVSCLANFRPSPNLPVSCCFLPLAVEQCAPPKRRWTAT